MVQFVFFDKNLNLNSMKILKTFLTTRLFLVLSLLFGAMSFSANAQKEILLYSTDFTDWKALDKASAGSDEVFDAEGGGAGFRLGSKPTIDPTGVACGGIGFIRNNSDSNLKLRFPEFNFVSGGAVELWLCAMTTSNTRQVVIPGADAVMIEAPVPVPASTRYDRIGVGTGTSISTNMAGASNTTLDVAKVGVYHAGSSWISSGGSTYYKVTYRLPAATFTGPKTIQLGSSDWHKDMAICAIKVYTGIGSVPYVACTNYAKNPADGHALSGTVGGAANSGTAINDLPNIKLWNSTSDVKLTIEGADAAKFSLVGADIDGSLTIPNTTALTGTNVAVSFTPSVRAGISTALLKIEAIGCQPYYIKLTGITGGATPQLVANPSTPFTFWTSLIQPVSQTINVAGLNLTNNVTLNITGPDAALFEVSQATLTVANATAGKTLNITFLGDINMGTKTATLEISSQGAQPLHISLTGITFETKPKLYSLTFAVDPSGTAFVDTNPAGTLFLDKTSVEVTVVPETNWKIKYWSDATGNRRSTRSITVGELKNTDNGQPIIIYMEAGTHIDPDPSSGTFVAFVPTTITNNSFVASWGSVTDATSYTVEVYDATTGSLIQTLPAIAGNTTVVSGLDPASYYSYLVKTTVSDGNGTVDHITDMVGPFKTTGSIPFVCGDGEF